MGSDMKTDPYNSWNGLQNVTVMSGCAFRRNVGVIGTEFFNKNFAPFFNDTNCKCPCPSGLMNSSFRLGNALHRMANSGCLQRTN